MSTIQRSEYALSLTSKESLIYHTHTQQFQKVFVINLHSRPDKLDQFALVSSLTGFTADVIEGVKGAEVQNKALPALAGLPNVCTILLT